jgi:hypothetical protein
MAGTDRSEVVQSVSERVIGPENCLRIVLIFGGWPGVSLMKQLRPLTWRPMGLGMDDPDILGYTGEMPVNRAS